MNLNNYLFWRLQTDTYKLNRGFQNSSVNHKSVSTTTLLGSTVIWSTHLPSFLSEIIVDSCFIVRFEESPATARQENQRCKTTVTQLACHFMKAIVKFWASRVASTFILEKKSHLPESKRLEIMVANNLKWHENSQWIKSNALRSLWFLKRNLHYKMLKNKNETHM